MKFFSDTNIQRETPVCVLTTIHPPTNFTGYLTRTLHRANIPLIVVGDRKGPVQFDHPSTLFLSLQDQYELDFSLAQKLPVNHYSRKNLGYLLAIQKNAHCIYETDDDTYPTEQWTPRTLFCKARPLEKSPWLNAYKCFTDEHIWPRGFPLNRVNEPLDDYRRYASQTVEAPVQQGLVNNAPDVDAVWRIVLNRKFYFNAGESILIPPRSWCPFNSQSTWWWPDAYPLLYLPSYCSFRMTDIWRSFIAQRCLWEMGFGVVFHSPDGEQERNPHDVLKDFQEEIPGYLNNEKITDLLMDLELSEKKEDVCDNFLKCYALLVNHGLFPDKELTLASAWIDDVKKV